MTETIRAAMQATIIELLTEYRKCRYGDEDEDGEVKEPPTKEEVQEYAAYLNFDLQANPELQWLAAEAIVRCISPAALTLTAASCRASLHLQWYGELMRPIPDCLNVQDAPLPPEWQEFEDEKQNTFFFNSVTDLWSSVP